MTAKEYLQQGYRIDQRINSKIAQVTNLTISEGIGSYDF